MNCSLCGSEVTVVSTGEGTNSYEPVLDAGRVLALLRAVEFRGGEYGCACLICRGEDSGGKETYHAPDCELAAVIKDLERQVQS